MSTHVSIPVSDATQRQLDTVTKDTVYEAIRMTASTSMGFKRIAKTLNVAKPVLWLRIHNNPEFDAIYSRAKLMQQDVNAETNQDDIVELIKSIKSGEYSEKILNALVNATKLKTSTREWVMERLSRKKYGQKLEVNATTTVTHEAGESLQRLTGQDLQTMLMLERKAAGKLDPTQEVQPLNVQVVESVQQPEVKPLNMLNNTTKKSNPEIDVI